MAMPSARAPFQASLSARNGLLRERQPLRRFAVVSGLEAALDDMCDYAFVPICSAPVVLYVWDQLVLSRWQMLPLLCVAFLVCLRSTLLNCTSPVAFQQAIKRMGPHLQQRAFQRAVSLLYPVPHPAATFDRQAGIPPARSAIDNAHKGKSHLHRTERSKRREPRTTSRFLIPGPQI
ncbi:ABC transmembrane type-1 domain-containing protein [Plasmodiophora brassicae]|nr:hypothetical protein PBRA_009258 [Plasmodiophora brassicae]